ncbi:MAG: 2Fe-2S iron-sulfur cluster-binding protein [Candidatus Electryonea clarkiae]|nr:2Fe-2S iron-sulfur cluster-binding protein [Candidatus Electryonea clarkiae]MDP8288278.1 2Fe-2S iron-sulfur cluster-binding protein [Candidatus Electryonea clarkiae]
MPKVTIDGIEVEVTDGLTILWAARKAGVEIPTYCYYPWFPPQGSCRICLVEVEAMMRGELVKMPKLQIACATPISDGMVIHTNNETVVKARRAVMEMLLLHHPLDCPVCDQAGECDLQDYGYKYGWPVGHNSHERRTYKKTDYGEKIAKEMNRCIHCRRCIRLSEEYLKVHHIGALNRGDHLEIGSYVEAEVPSEWAGNLIDVCPVGCLTDKKMRFSIRAWDLDHVPAYRPDCKHGCKCLLGISKGKIYRVTARFDKYHVMKSLICDECRFEHKNMDDWVIEEDDINTPLKKKIMKVPETDDA